MKNSKAVKTLFSLIRTIKNCLENLKELEMKTKAYCPVKMTINETKKSMEKPSTHCKNMVVE